MDADERSSEFLNKLLAVTVGGLPRNPQRFPGETAHTALGDKPVVTMKWSEFQNVAGLPRQAIWADWTHDWESGRKSSRMRVTGQSAHGSGECPRQHFWFLNQRPSAFISGFTSCLFAKNVVFA